MAVGVAQGVEDLAVGDGDDVEVGADGGGHDPGEAAVRLADRVTEGVVGGGDGQDVGVPADAGDCGGAGAADVAGLGLDVGEAGPAAVGQADALVEGGAAPVAWRARVVESAEAIVKETVWIFPGSHSVLVRPCPAVVTATAAGAPEPSRTGAAPVTTRSRCGRITSRSARGASAVTP
ncbi:hypothetical protein [Streptomyces omiyaensis]|uniref:hypothetical protein n=1 Tax=Streptomyces omiyaensis TaxID=68247 RepID=UPI0036FB6400